MNTVRPWAIMALIFVLGAVTGSLLTMSMAPRFGPPGAQELRSRWMHHLAWRLHLSDEQQAKIEPIIRSAEDEIQTAHHEDVARISGIMQKANASILPLLNPDQRTELAHMEAERERMWDGHLHGHSPGYGDHRPDGPGAPPAGSPPGPLPGA